MCQSMTAMQQMILWRGSQKGRKKEGTKEGENVQNEDMRIEEDMFPLVLSPHVPDSPMIYGEHCLAV